jgi:oligoribonuclease
MQGELNVRENPKFLAWIDLETTGSNEVEDDIIEVGLVVTDEYLNHREKRTWTVYPQRAGRLLDMDDVVVDMHTKSGLLADILKMKATPGNVISSVDISVSRALKPYVIDGKIPLAGSGVSHFDMRFIKRYMPETAALLTFAPYDIGSVRRFLRLAGVEIPDANLTHRALDDVEDHIAEARNYISGFRAADELNKKLEVLVG